MAGRPPHLRLDSLDVVRDAMPGDEVCVAVDHHVAGIRDPVARLADAARIEQRAAVKGECRAVTRGDRRDPPVVLGPDDRQVGVAVQPERVVMNDRFARATELDVTYSQSGSRGEPWTSV